MSCGRIPGSCLSTNVPRSSVAPPSIQRKGSCESNDDRPILVKKFSLTGLAVCSGAIILLSPLIRLLSFHLSLHNGVRTYDFDLYTWNAADGLACGALVATLLRLKPIERRQLWRIASMLFAFETAIFVIGFPLGILTRERPVGAALQPTPWNFAFVSLLLVFLLVGASDRKNLVIRPVLRFFGEISYGLYLFHVLCFDVYDALIRRFYPTLVGAVRSDEYVHTIAAQPSFSLLCLRFVVAATAAILVSYASRRWFETPFLRLKDRLAKPQSRSAADPKEEHVLVAPDQEARSSDDASPPEVPKQSSVASA